MKTKTMKILVTIATVLLVLSIGASTVLGAGITLKPNDIVADLDGNTSNEIKSIGGKAIGLIQGVGVVLTVVILSILGIKYMMGSAEEKAEYKKTMIPYVIGAICIFASTTIANLVYRIASF